MYNKKSLQNLKKFSKDYQPKKRGRKKGSVSITREIKKVLGSVDEGSQKQVAEILATAIIKQAMKGNKDCMREVMDRVDGKVPDKAELTRKDKEPITFKVKYVEGDKLDKS